MPRFEIFSDGVLIGWSELELGDAPMGVAFGRFLPAPSYESVRQVIVSAAGGPLPGNIRLSVREHDGQLFHASGGVHLVDFSAEAGAGGFEVSVLGVSYPRYESLFPKHVAAYKRQFPHAG